MNFLALSILALILGPLLYRLVRRREPMLLLLDGFIFVTIGGLILFYVLPESVEQGGWWAIFFALLGLLGPTLIEKGFHRAAHQTHLAALALGIAGVGLHGLIDGTALAEQGPGVRAGGSLLPLAVILHRFPEGLTIWWLLRPSFGLRTAVATLSLVGLSTVAGFTIGPWMTGHLSGDAIAWFQAFLAGSLLHVIFHQPHLREEDCACHQRSLQTGWFAGSGAILGVALLALLITTSAEWNASANTEMAETFWTLLLESAPALLLAYLMAGLISSFLPRSSIGWMGRGNSIAQSVKGMLVGLPMPVCSCGVVPLYQSLIRKGAPTTAGLAFLVATPELGLDAVLLSIPLLGMEMTLIRVVGAALVALLVGSVVGRFGGLHKQPPVLQTMESPRSLPPPFPDKLRSALKTGLGEVVDHTAPWILLGLLVAAVAQPLLSQGWMAAIPSTLEVILFALLGLPVYVCASGATPLVAVLLLNGISPGAALAFLLTGPATNITTFGLLGQLHGRRLATLFSATMIGLPVAFGYLVNALFPLAGQGVIVPAEAGEATSWQLLCLSALLLIYLFSLLRRGARRFFAELVFRSEHVIDLHPHF